MEIHEDWLADNKAYLTQYCAAVEARAQQREIERVHPAGLSGVRLVTGREYTVSSLGGPTSK